MLRAALSLADAGALQRRMPVDAGGRWWTLVANDAWPRRPTVRAKKLTVNSHKILEDPRLNIC